MGRLAGVHVNMAERMSLFRKGVLVVACRAVGVPVVLHLLDRRSQGTATSAQVA